MKQSGGESLWSAFWWEMTALGIVLTAAAYVVAAELCDLLRVRRREPEWRKKLDADRRLV